MIRLKIPPICPLRLLLFKILHSHPKSNITNLSVVARPCRTKSDPHSSIGISHAPHRHHLNG